MTIGWWRQSTIGARSQSAIPNAFGGLVVTFAGELKVGIPIPDRRRSFPNEERA